MSKDKLEKEKIVKSIEESEEKEALQCEVNEKPWPIRGIGLEALSLKSLKAFLPLLETRDSGEVEVQKYKDEKLTYYFLVL